ncbi:uncharacterized protein LOC119364120 isoform X3 [Triticum dicoccoides]|uniref:uncharacterized protein LOC119364120 isoform X3 n=1 Tax=Triticum dicoccoides TaxID=85692 RepID=UPI00188EB2EE|nr:uncharacterized protein LOC119364120 isoform X3 [Triticum dicoccoides]
MQENWMSRWRGKPPRLAAALHRNVHLQDFTTAMDKRRLKLGKTTMSGANRDPKCREAGFIFPHHHNKGETPGRERKAAQVPLEARKLGAVAEEELHFHGVERRGAPASLQRREEIHCHCT